MQPAPKQLFCRVDRKTLEIIEGPKPLPQNWGNVSGFNNLRAPDVKKYGWYPLADFSLVPATEIDFSLVFLPEKEHVVKVFPTHNAKGLKDHVIAHLQAHTKHALGSMKFYSTAMGEPLHFSNDPEEISYRLSCLALGTSYECIVRDQNGQTRFISVPHEKLDGLIRDIHSHSASVRQKMKAKFDIIENESPEGLRALLDTDLVDLYDE